MRRIDRTDIEANSCPEPNTGCWLWLGPLSKKGYPVLGYEGRNRRTFAHRASFKRYHGDAGPLLVLHKCDTPSCVNPAHLFKGSQADNVADMFRKGRARCGKLRGEDHGQAKLTDVEVIEIRSANATHEALARTYGVCRQHISAIRSGRKWAS